MTLQIRSADEAAQIFGTREGIARRTTPAGTAMSGHLGRIDPVQPHTRGPAPQRVPIYYLRSLAFEFVTVGRHADRWKSDEDADNSEQGNEADQIPLEVTWSTPWRLSIRSLSLWPVAAKLLLILRRAPEFMNCPHGLAITAILAFET